MEVDAYTSHIVEVEDESSAEPVDTDDWDLVAFAFAQAWVAVAWTCNSNTSHWLKWHSISNLNQQVYFLVQS
jgi:hypothetical protein